MSCFIYRHVVEWNHLGEITLKVGVLQSRQVLYFSLLI